MNVAVGIAKIHGNSGLATRQRPRPWSNLTGGFNMAKRTCSVEGCERPSLARGWCGAHYYRWQTHGDVRADVPVAEKPRDRVCSVDGCLNKHFANGYCNKHRIRVARHGTIADPVREVRDPVDRFWEKVNKGKAENDCWLWTGAHRLDLGYGWFYGGPGRPALSAHRFAYELLVGPIPDGLHLDHLCRTPACVNPAHLEPVTPIENNRRARVARDGQS